MRARIAAFIFGSQVREDAPNAPKLTDARANLARHIADGGKMVVRGLANIFGFILRHPILIVVLAFFFFGLGLLRGCVPELPWHKSRDAIALEARLAQAEAETQLALNARDAIIAQAAQAAAVHRAQIRSLLEQGHRDIEAATPQNETPIDAGLESAWRASLGRLQLYPAGDAASPNPGGSSAAL